MTNLERIEKIQETEKELAAILETLHYYDVKNGARNQLEVLEEELKIAKQQATRILKVFLAK